MRRLALLVVAGCGVGAVAGVLTGVPLLAHGRESGLVFLGMGVWCAWCTVDAWWYWRGWEV